MAQRKKQSSKVQKRKGTTARPKTRKLSKTARGKVTKRTVARAKPKRAQVKKAAGPVTAAVETVAGEGFEYPAHGGRGSGGTSSELNRGHIEAWQS